MNDIKIMEMLLRIFYLIVLLSKSSLAQSLCSNLNAASKSSCDESSGEFLGLCGVCVGGRTGRAASWGVDRCGACGGEDLCLGCDGRSDTETALDACGRCLSPTDPAFNADCTKITNVAPRTLDKSYSLSATVTLTGVGISPGNIPGTRCKVEPAGQPAGTTGLEVLNQLVADGVIQLEVFIGLKQAGNFTVRCETAGVGVIGVAAGEGLVVVESRSLSVTGANVKNLTVGQTVEIILSVPLAKRDVELVTFAHDKNRDVTYLIRFFEIRDGEVRFNFTARKAKIVEFGVAYTEEAAMDRESHGRIVEITVTCDAPKLVNATFTDDVQKILVAFDRNIDTPKDCARSFSSGTSRLLGTGATCTEVANVLVVTLGSKPTVQLASRIELSEDSGIYSELSNPKLAVAASGGVEIGSTPAKMKVLKPAYEVFPPSLICANKVSESEGRQPIRISAPGQSLDYKWDVLFDLAQPKRAPSQRETIIIWRSVRELQRDLVDKSKKAANEEIIVNSTILKPGIIYKVNFSASNSLHMEGDYKTFPMKLVEDNSIDSSVETTRLELTLVGSTTTYANVDYHLRARVSSCGVEITRPFDYKWSVSTESREIDLRLQRGRRLKIPAMTLQGGLTYSISCVVTSKTPESPQSSVQTSLQLLVLKHGLQLTVTPSEVTLGTNQVLHLDASCSLDPDNLPGPLAFQWCCRRETGEQCTIPEPGGVTLSQRHKEMMREAVLILPDGDLPMGTYIFTVELSKPGQSPVTSSSRVLVIAGTPPSTYITANSALSLVNPSVGVTLAGSAWGVQSGCSVWWSVDQVTGFQFFDLDAIGLGDGVKLSMEEDGEARMSVVAERDFPLVIPTPIGNWAGLKGDAAYKLRLSAFCPARVTRSVPREGHCEVVFHTNQPPAVKPLVVRPQEGEALKTMFTFSTEAAYDSLQDHPLTYHFGYQTYYEQEPIFIGASSVEREIRTFLPAEEPSENRVRPVLKVCDARKTCTTVRGSNNVTTTFPKSLSQSDVDRVMSEFDEQMSTQHYMLAFDLARNLLRLLTMINTELFAGGSKAVSDRMQGEIIFLKETVDSSPVSLQLGLDFLDMTLRTIAELPANALPSINLMDLTELKDRIMKLQDSAPAKIRGYRFKRDAAKSGFTPESVNTFLKTMEFLITNPAVDDTHKTLAKKKLIEDDIHSYMSNLCHSSYVANGLPLFISSSIVSFSVQQITREMFVSEIDVPSGQRRKPQTPATTVILGTDVADIVDKTPFCIGTAAFTHDYLTEVYTKPMESNFNDRQVFEVQLFESESHQQLKLSLKNATISLRLPVNETTLQPGYWLICVVWTGKAWDGDECHTGGIVERGGVSFLACQCKTTGYFKVGLAKDVEITTTSTLASTTVLSTMPLTTRTVPSTSTTPTTTAKTTTKPTTTLTTTIPPSTSTTLMTTSTTTQSTTAPSTSTTSTVPTTTVHDKLTAIPISNVSRNVSFRIEEDFNSTVGEEKAKFEEKVRDQILDQSKMPPAMVKDIEVSPEVKSAAGSSLAGITVTLHLLDTDVKSANEMIDVVAQLLSHGLLELLDLNGKRMTVPPQRITVMEQYRAEDDDALMYGAISFMLISVTIVSVVVIGVLIVRKRRDSARRRAMEESTQGRTLRYRRFHFEQSLDGSEASLARYRTSQPSVGSVSFSAAPILSPSPETSTSLGLAGQILQVPRLGLIKLQRSLPGGRAEGIGSHFGNREGLGSAGRLLTSEEIQLEDAGPSRDRRKVKNLDSSTISFDTLPGMPEGEIQ